MSRLNRRACHRTVRTKYATIARQRLEPLAAAFAVIEKQAGVGRHMFDRLMSAPRTRDRAFSLHYGATRANWSCALSMIAARTARASVVPSASPFSKSNPACPIVLVTWARHSTCAPMARANV
jgi:hypothetical protein